MEDNEVFLVIVGDESEEVQIPLPIQMKVEKEDDVYVEDIIEKVKRHGEYVKIEPENEYEYECPDGDEEQSSEYVMKQEAPDIDYSIDDDEEYSIPEVEIQPKQKARNSELRRSMRSPSEHKSFVADLKEQYPELKRDKKLLVKTLCEIMRSLKHPPLPNDYYVLHDGAFICTKCGHASETKPAAGRHYREKHGPRYLMCYACGVDFRSTTNLYKHEKRCVGADRRVVLRARAACLGNKGRGRPFMRYRRLVPPTAPQQKYQCPECSAVFSSNGKQFQSHMFLHHGLRPFQCKECPAAYTSASALLRHSKKHSDVQYICDHCQRPFKLKAALVAHMDSHLPVRKFGCDLCDRRFAQKQALVLHVDRVHYNLPPPHACTICPKRYARMSLLKTHMQNEHGLAIMTRKMFLKRLPMLTDAEMQQAAKIVCKSDLPQQHYFKQLDNNLDFLDQVKEESVSEEITYLLPDHPTEDFVEYFQ